jgi:hypothetical protein
MADKSQNDLAEAVLTQIGVLDAGEDPDPLDVTLIQTVYTSKHLDWTERGYVDWPNGGNPATTEIPENAFHALTQLMANEMLPSFGTPVPEEQRVSREQILLVSLRRLVAGTAEDVCGDNTKKQLSTAVLRRLGVIDPLATPENKDAAYVWSAYDNRYALLRSQDLTYWPNTGHNVAEIPKEVFLDLVRIITSDVAPIFGADPGAEMDDNGSMIAPGVLGMKNLRRLMGRAPTGLPTRAEYF